MSKLAPWQVWRADLDPREGKVQAGERPVLIVSSPFHVRVTAGELVVTLPLTSRERPGWLHHVPILVNGHQSYAMTDQPRTIARSRLIGRQPLARLDPHDIAAVREALGEMIDI